MIKHVRNLPHNPTDGLDITCEPRQVDAHCGIVVGLLWERFGLYLQLGWTMDALLALLLEESVGLEQSGAYIYIYCVEKVFMVEFPVGPPALAISFESKFKCM